MAVPTFSVLDLSFSLFLFRSGAVVDSSSRVVSRSHLEGLGFRVEGDKQADEDDG